MPANHQKPNLTESEFNNLIEAGYNNIPLINYISAPATTLAIDLYETLGDSPFSFLYESAYKKHNNTHLSVMGLSASHIFEVKKCEISHSNGNKKIFNGKYKADYINKHLDKIKTAPIADDISDLPIFNGGLVGYYGFETIGYKNTKLTSGLDLPDDTNMHDIVLWQTETMLIINHLSKQIMVICYSGENNYKNTLDKLDNLTEKVKSASKNTNNNKIQKLKNIPTSQKVKNPETEKANFKSNLQKIIKYIKNGDVIQVVPSHKTIIDFPKECAVTLYRQLRRISPSPHMYILHTRDEQIIGASPEILININKKNQVTLRPLAGTRPRGSDIETDRKMEQDLIQDEKEISEHLMLIDLARNDLGKIAETASVKIKEQMVIEKYAKVMHMSSTLVANKKPNYDIFEVLHSAHPAGTLSGAPKIRAIEIIQELEKTKRGVYGGFIAFLGFDKSVKSCIAIRTGIIKNNQLHIQAGAGIVADSDPEKEWQEVCNKKSALLTAALNSLKYCK